MYDSQEMKILRYENDGVKNIASSSRSLLPDEINTI